MAQIAVDWAAYLKNVKAAGGKFDIVTLDTECTFDAFSAGGWQTAYNPLLTEACQNQHFEAIQSDARFPAVLTLLKRNGFVPNGTSDNWLADSLIWKATENFNVNMAAWQTVMTQRTVEYKNTAYYVPAKAANPDVVLSDYDDVTWSTGACTMDMNGFWANGCNHANNTKVTGNRQAPDFYGWMHNITDDKNFPGSAQTLGHEFQISPFDSLMWSVYQMRMYRLSAPETPVKPWLAVRSYCGDGDYGPPVLGSNPRVGWCNTDYYQEIALHLGLLGADDFLLFNPCFGTCTKDQKANGTAMMTLADNELYSTLFTELSGIVGYDKREWIQEPTPGGWRCSYMLSGMTTPVARVWRFTAQDGKPASHLTQDGTTVTLSAKQQDGSPAHVVFEKAVIVASATAGAAKPVSTVGLWINQSLAAAMPTGWQCTVKTDDTDLHSNHLELFVDGRAAQTGSIYDDGKGGEQGTINRPFGTLAAAIMAVRTLPQRQRCGLVVTIAGGVYGGVDNLFRLTEADNGCVGQPIVYRADPNSNESVVLHGGAEIPPTSFKANGSTTSGLKVWAADLAEVGLGALAATSGSFLPGWFPGPAPARSCANGNRTELFFGGHAMTLARHPNKKAGAATLDQGIWQYLRVSAHGLMTPTLFKIGTDDTDGKKPPADAPFLHDLGRQTFAHGFWSFDWADSFAPVKSVTANSSGAFVELATAPAFGPPKIGARFVLMNSKSLLDAEGEYYISAADGTLHFIPPAGMDPSVHQSGTGQGAFLSEQTAAHKFIGVKHITLQSLKLDYAMGSAISAVNVTGLSVINCSLSNSGTHGVELSGTNSSIESSEISDIGCDAVVVTGGDPVLLHDANLLVHNNSIHAFARVHRTVRPGIAWSGCGITVSANEIFDAPHSGIVIIGAPNTGASDGVSVNCVFEDNYLHDLCKGTADAGGFYAGKSWANRGNVIRRNRFQDFASVEILAMHTTVEKAGTGVNGIYLDDMESGWLIESNTFTRAGELCVMIGGGRQVRGPLSNHDPFPTPTCTIHFKKLSSWAKFGVL